ncbi:hypothetical protein TNCV_2624021 [Trichonephila clavipes]|nr:hypothetical protein TNCV_2624021 [Trichonephila clavipes]
MYVSFGVPWAQNLCLWMTTPALTVQTSKRMPLIRGYHPYGLVSILTGLESSRAFVGHTWSMSYIPSTTSYMPTGTSENMNSVIFPKIRQII